MRYNCARTDQRSLTNGNSWKDRSIASARRSALYVGWPQIPVSICLKNTLLHSRARIGIIRKYHATPNKHFFNGNPFTYE